MNDVNDNLSNLEIIPNLDLNSQLNFAGKIHFIGIGGIGMSAIAKILNNMGFSIQGSDLVENSNTKELEENGIKFFINHKSQNITEEVALVVKTSIIKDNNPEILQAKARNIPIIRRADMLAKIMKEKLNITVAGTHGKTTTTAMIAVLLEDSGFDPTVINGGIINYFGSNAKIGRGKFLVAESDESDASFVDLPTFIGVVNNIEPEHLEFYGGDFTKVKNLYRQYIDQIPKNGLVTMCIDDLEVKNIYQQLSQHKQNIVSLSVIDSKADIFAYNISFDAKGLKFDVKIRKTDQIIENIKMKAYGIFNIKNALAPIAVGLFLGINAEQIKRGLERFSGVKRRFSKYGEVGGVSIIDDYGHHPTEIQAVFKAAKSILPNNQLIVVFQPHKYSRTKDLFDEFCNSFFDADIVLVSEIYSAGQEPIAGVTQDALIEGIKKVGHKNVIKLLNEESLPSIIKSQAKKGDMVICIGAGSIGLWASRLSQKLKEFN